MPDEPQPPPGPCSPKIPTLIRVGEDHYCNANYLIDARRIVPGPGGEGLVVLVPGLTFSVSGDAADRFFARLEQLTPPDTQPVRGVVTKASVSRPAGPGLTDDPAACSE